MEWSNSKKEPTENRINHGRFGGVSHNQLLQLLPLPAGFLFLLIQIFIHLNSF